MKKILFMFLILSLLLTAVGCGKGAVANSAENDGQLISPHPENEEVEITMYFPNQEGTYLQKEVRSVIRSTESLEELVVKTFLEGPKSPELASFLPAGVQVGNVYNENGTVYVDFSPEIKNIHRSVEGITVKSLVNSLTELPGVTSVQILIGGAKAGTIAGNSSILEPLERNMNVVTTEEFKAIPPARPQDGELFVEGQVERVVVGEKTLYIQQLINEPNAQEIDPEVKIADDAIIHVIADGKEENFLLDDIGKGDYVGLIINKEGLARAVIVTRVN